MRTRNVLAGAVLALFLAACTTTDQADLSGMTFSDAPLTGKVIWNDLITEDIVAAKAFYGGLFGWTFESVTRDNVDEYVVARLDDRIVAGILSTDARSDEDVSRWLPYMSVNDVDVAVNQSVAAGATVAAAARSVDLGRAAVIIDPEGAVIGLVRSKIGDPDDLTTSAAPGRVVWSELLSSDPAAAAAFYRGLAGLDVEVINRRGGQYTILSANGVRRGGILERPNEQIEPVWLTYFGVSDPAAAAAKAASLGGTVIVAPSPEVREGAMAIVTDPAGAVLVLQKTPI